MQSWSRCSSKVSRLVRPFTAARWLTFREDGLQSDVRDPAATQEGDLRPRSEGQNEEDISCTEAEICIAAVSGERFSVKSLSVSVVRYDESFSVYYGRRSVRVPML